MEAMTVSVSTNKTLDDLLAAVDTEKPTKAAKQALAAYLQENGAAQLAKIGDLSHRLTNIMIHDAFKGNYGFALAVGEKCNDLEDELGIDQATPLEQMLIKNVVVCWLRCYQDEIRYELKRGDGMTIAVSTFWQRKLTANQRRYLRAVETLAKVRRLLYKPNVNVNVLNFGS